MKKILITGFAPFLNETINPSQKIAESLASEYDTLILPVTFEQSWELLSAKLGQNNYDFVLMLGQAAGRVNICLEQVALNFLDSKSPDEAGVFRQAEQIVKGGSNAFISPLPLRQWSQDLQVAGYFVERSLSAGSYVCNFIYYQILHQEKYFSKALFVHVPYLPSQLEGKKADTPSMPLGQMIQTVKAILKIIEAI